MRNNCALVVCLLVLASAGASEASPLDSPDIVYIDGLPCNSLCRSYMSWSHDMSSVPAPPMPSMPAQRPQQAVVDRAKTTRAKVAHVQPAPNAAADSEASHRATRARAEERHPAAQAREDKEDKPVAPNSAQAPQAKTANLQPTGNATADSGKMGMSLADPHPKAGLATGSSTATIQEQVAAATAAALQLTAATAVPAPQRKANNDGGSDHAASAPPAEAETPAPAPPNHPDLLVALLMTRAEIKSVSDLTGKTIATDDRQSASNGDVRSAIVAAGAAEVQLSDDHTRAIDQLISGAVPAAVLALVSVEAARAFPAIEGFKIFQIPLSPSSLKAGGDTP
jgi:hypothetical protein